MKETWLEEQYNTGGLQIYLKKETWLEARYLISDLKI